MHLVWTILIGFVAGVIARMFVSGGDNPTGFFMTAALGIGGSLAATYIGHMLGLYKAGSSAGFIGAIVGAMILLGLYHMLTKK